MRKTLLLFSGPTLVSRSWSREEARLKAGEADVDGPGTAGDRAEGFWKMSWRTDGCR